LSLSQLWNAFNNAKINYKKISFDFQADFSYEEHNFLYKCQNALSSFENVWTGLKK